MKTIITGYYLDINIPEQANQYRALRAKLTDRECFNVISDRYDDKRDNWSHTGEEITLETKHLFTNQWNTECGRRVFDWYEGIYTNRNVKAGHYLQITDEMVELRNTVHKCGYCGAHYAQSKLESLQMKFCTDCISSEYLTEDHLHLLRLQPVNNDRNRKKLTNKELSILLPRYVEAQTKATTERQAVSAENLRVKLIKERDDAVNIALIKYEGFTWLLDNGINIDNCIYYAHSDKFTFGWRHSIDKSVRAELESLLADFPFKYEVK